jgi:hypothetical protein
MTFVALHCFLLFWNAALYIVRIVSRTVNILINGLTFETGWTFAMDGNKDFSLLYSLRRSARFFNFLLMVFLRLIDELVEDTSLLLVVAGFVPIVESLVSVASILPRICCNLNWKPKFLNNFRL